MEKTYVPSAISRKPSQEDRDRFGDKWKEFWRAYPKRDGGQNRAWAETIFYALLKDGEDADTIIIATRDFCDKAKSNGSYGSRYIPHMSTYLNQRRWEDYVI